MNWQLIVLILEEVDADLPSGVRRSLATTIPAEADAVDFAKHMFTHFPKAVQITVVKVTYNEATHLGVVSNPELS